MQIAHMINQLSHKSEIIKELVRGNDTLMSFEESAVSLLMVGNFENNINKLINTKCQMRY